MKGIILAGGTCSRMMPLTKVTNKYLLPVYDKPTIYYPLQTLIDMGIKKIMIVTARGHAGHFLELLASGADFSVNFSKAIQEKAGGIAETLGLCEDFADNSSVAVILGDNIFEDNFKDVIASYKEGALIFLKEMKDVNRFGVATLDRNNDVIKIVEKPRNPETNYAVTGLYVYDNKVFDIIKTLKPLDRGELEITDVNNHYVRKGMMKAQIVKGFWSDARTFESLHRACTYIFNKHK